MGKFFFKKFITLLVVLFGVSLVSFSIIRLAPGDPVMMLIGERGADAETYAIMKHNLGLDRSLPIQYWHFITSAMQGDLGTSVVSKEKVSTEFFARFPATLELGMFAMFFAVIIGIPVGILAAIYRNSFWDYLAMGTSLIGYSMPIFWWGLILILFFSVGLGWTPVSGRISVMFDIPTVTGFMLIDTLISAERWPAFFDALKHLILPAVAMGTIPLAIIARMTRSSMLEVIEADYIRTAMAQGIPSYYIIFVLALRNAMIPIVTVIGLMFGSIITGAILTETIFSWPGIGKWLVAAVNQRDYPFIQGSCLIIASMIVFINMMIDLSYFWINPKMRGSR